jgi:SAM-dependent methyltransferase
VAALALGWLRRRGLELVEAPLPRQARVPPRRLRARTGVPGAREFVGRGREAAAELAGALAAAGLGELAAFGSVLDFGCGSARVLPHVAARAPEARCEGCDVDAEAIAWAAARHPELRLAAIGPSPPLPYRAASFALVYSISVFSHLDERAQDAWLAELARVLAPGGVALLSVHGPSAFERFRAGRARAGWCPPGAFARGPLGDDELAFVPYVRSRLNALELPGVGERYGLAFHDHEYLRGHWSRWLEVAAIHERAITDWQDLVVCRAASARDSPQQIATRAVPGTDGPADPGSLRVQRS